MTTENFDYARYGRMSIADLAVAFEQLVGAPPEKKNKPWMLKRMDQAHSSRQAVERAAARARAGGDAGESAQAPAAEEPEVAPPLPEGTTAAMPPEPELPATEGAPARETPAAPFAPVSPLAAEAPAPANEVVVGRPTTATVTAAVETADDSAASSQPTGTVRRKYVPARFKGKSLEELQAMYLQAVGRPTKSVDVPYIAWKIGLTERKGAPPSTTPRRARRVGAGRGEAKAVTLREYPDTLTAVEQVCARHGFRNRLDFFRLAAHHFLEHLGERAAAAFFAEMAPSPPAASASSQS